jgi:hypothetical protein
MSNVKRETWWQRRQSLRAGEAALLGFAIGSAAAIVAALTPPRDFTSSFLVLLMLTIGPSGGIAGYMLWLSFDPVRGERLRWITSIVALPAILGLLVAFPNFWREMERSMGSLMINLFLCFVFSVIGFTVATGLGIVHLVGHLAVSLRCFAKPGAVPRMDGVWDRELDQN